MFATLGDLLSYLFGTRMNIPVPTFAFFAVVAVLLGVIILLLEFKQYQSIGNAILPHYPAKYKVWLIMVSAIAVGWFAGARLFYIATHWNEFLRAPNRLFFSLHGYNYAGGLLFGILVYLYMGYRHKIKLLFLLDIGAPVLLLAYGIIRLGCHLSGDGDWGIMNAAQKPGWLAWLPGGIWSSRFPHNTANAGLPIPTCTGRYCTQLIEGVYPTSCYEAVLCIVMFVMLWALRKRIIIPGLMVSFYLTLQGSELLLIGGIRINPYYSVFGITLTQAQLLGGAMLLTGLAGLTAALYQRNSNPPQQHISA